MTESQSPIPPSLRLVLNDSNEIDVFRKFQTSSTINKVLEAPGPVTEYNEAQSTWLVPSARYLGTLLQPSVADDSGKTQPSPSWQEVLDIISNARERYESKGQKSKIRRGLRKGQDVAVVLQSLAELIPDEYGLSILRVALSKLFTGWSDRIKNCERVLEALESIPITMCFALERWHIFRNDEHLVAAVQQLYQNCMNAIRDLIDILNHKPGSTSRKNRLAFTVKQILPGQEANMIEQALKTVTNAEKNVIHNIDRLDRAMAAGTHHHAIATHEAVTKIATQVKTQHQENTAHLGKLQVSTLEMVSATIQKAGSDLSTKVSQELWGIHTDLATMKESFQQFSMNGLVLVRRDMLEALQQKEELCTSFYNLNGEQSWKRDLFPQSTPRVSNLILSAGREPQIFPEQILYMLGVEHLSPVKDRDVVLRKGHTMTPYQLGRGRYLLQVPSFQQLLSSPAPGLLLVDGHCREECEGKISPISVFCASLAAVMVHNPECLVLHYFAGQHCFDEQSDPACGPAGMMRSLICQLLCHTGQIQLDLEWMTDALVNDVDIGDVDALCFLFQRLLQQVVGVSKIFCILDNLSEFEKSRNGWATALDGVFDHLSSMHGSLSPGLSFKLLITNAEKSWQLAHKTSEWEHVSLRAGNTMSSDKSARAVAADLQRAALREIAQNPFDREENW